MPAGGDGSGDIEAAVDMDMSVAEDLLMEEEEVIEG